MQHHKSVADNGIAEASSAVVGVLIGATLGIAVAGLMSAPRTERKIKRALRRLEHATHKMNRH